ncbi:hypothetical protein IKA92_04150 [bacterium]|nr:hypothetical protein [bacterium]
MDMMKICPRCQTAHSKLELKCPVCGYEKTYSPKSFYWFLFIIGFALAICSESTDLISKIEDSFHPQNRFDYLARKRVENNKNYDIVNIPINEMTDLTPMSKEEILNLRKEMVHKSVVFLKN